MCVMSVHCGWQQLHWKYQTIQERMQGDRYVAMPQQLMVCVGKIWCFESASKFVVGSMQRQRTGEKTEYVGHWLVVA